MMRVFSAWLVLSLMMVVPAARAAEDNEFEVTGVGQQVQHACTAAQPSVSITGTDHQVTLSGECQQVEINGTNNVVTMDAVGRISVTGTNNRATYRRALGSGKKGPKIERTGVGNSVSKAK